MKLTESEIVLLDVETCNPQTPKVIELAGLRWKMGRPIAAAHFKETFIDPGQKVDPATQSVHHISDKDLEGAPRLEDIQDEWKDWVGDRIIVAYNSEFDRTALSSTPLFDCSWLDAYRAAMHFWSLGQENDDGFALSSLKQQELRYWLKVPEVLGDAHRAAADIQVTAYVMERIMQNYLECGQKDSMESFVSFVNGPICHDTFPIGGKIFQGKRAEDVPDWALRKAFDEESDWHAPFAKFNVLDCLRPEFVRRFGVTPEKPQPSRSSGFKPAIKTQQPPPSSSPGPDRWKRTSQF